MPAPGYGYFHEQRRQQLLTALALDPGSMHCPMCSKALDVSMELDLHHSGGVAAKRRGAPGDILACRPCNRATKKAGERPAKAAFPRRGHVLHQRECQHLGDWHREPVPSASPRPCAACGGFSDCRIWPDPAAPVREPSLS